MCETDQKSSKKAPRVATGDRAILPEGAKTIPVYIMGKMYEVPETLTIMKAMEFAGFKFLRGAGCRGGICGACPTVYRNCSRVYKQKYRCRSSFYSGIFIMNQKQPIPFIF